MTQGEGTKTLLFSPHLEKASGYPLDSGVRLEPSSAVLALCVTSDKIFSLSGPRSCPKPDSLYGESNQLFRSFPTCPPPTQNPFLEEKS